MGVVIDVRPLSAALSVLIPLVIESRRLVSSPARAESAAAVKKLVGLSRAELTFLPVARRCCVVCWREVVSCSESRLARTPAVRVTLDMGKNLSGLGAVLAVESDRSIEIGVDHIGRRLPSSHARK